MGCDPFGEALLAERRHMLGRAIRMTGSIDRGEDLLHDTYAKALKYKDSFVLGTNMTLWLAVIMRNVYFSQRRKDRSVEDPDGFIAMANLTIPPGQEHYADLHRVVDMLDNAPQATKKKIQLVVDGAMGHTLEDMASREKVRLGTIKSRMSRGRAILQDALG
jgi:RNA polymerase sigma-70 factor (ECF subfamily)